MEVRHRRDRSDLEELADVELASRVAQGDAAALEALYDRHAPVVYSLALRIVGDAPSAEELLQDVFFRVWQQAAAFRADRGAFRAWVLTMTHHRAVDELRRRQRRPRPADGRASDLLLAAVVDARPDVYFDPQRAPLNHAIFGPNPTFTGELVAGEVTIAAPSTLPLLPAATPAP